MKYFLLSLVFIVFSVSSFAGFPFNGYRDFCNQNCSTMQRFMYNDFSKKEIFYTKGEKVFSGDCFHSSRYYDGKKLHHGVIVFDSVKEKIYMSSSFSFFTIENPFRSWNMDIARDELGDFYSQKNELQGDERTGFASVGDESYPVAYWFRRPSHDTLFLIGLWTTSHKVTCYLRLNQ